MQVLETVKIDPRSVRRDGLLLNDPVTGAVMIDPVVRAVRRHARPIMKQSGKNMWQLLLSTPP